MRVLNNGRQTPIRVGVPASAVQSPAPMRLMLSSLSTRLLVRASPAR
jgi:hypothetical protein